MKPTEKEIWYSFVAAFFIVAAFAVLREKKKAGIVHCTGYTVLDSSRIILCNNDTIHIDWRRSYGRGNKNKP
jgi:hypothetical protein